MSRSQQQQPPSSLAAPRRSEILRVCFLGDGSGSLADRVAMLAAWCLTLAILSYNALFRVLFPDGNLLIRAVSTLILSTPLFLLYARGKRLVRARESAHSR